MVIELARSLYREYIDIILLHISYLFNFAYYSMIVFGEGDVLSYFGCVPSDIVFGG